MIRTWWRRLVPPHTEVQLAREDRDRLDAIRYALDRFTAELRVTREACQKMLNHLP
jgi:hypothetical protein